MAAGLGLGLAACTAAPSSSELTDALVTSGIEPPVAECVAEAVTSSLSEDELIVLVERGPGGVPRDDPERTDDAADQLRDAVAECRAQADQAAAEALTDAGN